MLLNTLDLRMHQKRKSSKSRAQLPGTANVMGFLQPGMKTALPLVPSRDILERGASVLVPVVILVLPSRHPGFLIPNPEPRGGWSFWGVSGWGYLE